MTTDTTNTTSADTQSPPVDEQPSEHGETITDVVSRRVHSLFAAVFGPASSAVTDGGARKFNRENVEETSRGDRVDSPDESTSPPSPDSSREYDPLAPICNYCGLPVDHAERRCPARETGRCRP